MARRFDGDTLVIATHNRGKLVEMQALLAPYRIVCVSAGELGLPEPDETGTTFEANAELKAREATTRSGLPALADDLGLVVAGLGGAPGIYSARWAGPSKDFGPAMERVERELAGKTDRSAYFVAVLSLAWPDGHIESFRGEIHGSVIWPPRGSLGFGYDPIFLPAGQNHTFGELDPAIRQRISHRSIAFQRLTAACFGAPPSQ